MKKIFILLGIPLLLSACQQQQYFTSGFDEPADPDSLSWVSGWDTCAPGIHASFGSTDLQYARTAVPDSGLSPRWTVTGWKGETVHTQLVLWSNKDVSAIDVTAGFLRDGRGHQIDTTSFTLSPVGYVITDAFLSGCGRRDKDTIPWHLAPDILYPNRVFTLPGRTTRPVWVSLHIPAGASSGTYTGTVQLYPEDDSILLPIQLKVQDLMLPPPAEWRFHLDLWQNPFSIARVHHVALWSEEHWELIRKYLQLLAGAGQQCITTAIVDHPWGGQTLDSFLPMITWLHNSSGSWDYDYSLFDQYVEAAMDCGITKQINCYTMVPWGNRFTWYEEDSSRYVTRELQPGTKDYEEVWQPFLWDFREHLRQRNWLDRTTIAMDERNHDQMAELLAFLKKTAPEFKVTLAGHYYPDLISSIYDFSFNWGLLDKATPDVIRDRSAAGLQTTFYVACGVQKPNTFTFSSPREATYLGWVAAAFGFDGFLRWAYNSWPENPLKDSRFITWPAGDTYLVYPGPLSSVRFEKLKEGIQDYEKIRIIEEIMKASENQEQLKLYSQLKGLLQQIHSNPDNADIEKTVLKGKEFINFTR